MGGAPPFGEVVLLPYRRGWPSLCGSVEGGPPPLRLHGTVGHNFLRKHCSLSQGGHYGVGGLKGPLLGTHLDGIMGKIQLLKQ